MSYFNVKKKIVVRKSFSQQDLGMGCLEAHLMKLHILFYKYFQSKPLDVKFINNIKLMHNRVKRIRVNYIKDKISQ